MAMVKPSSNLTSIGVAIKKKSETLHHYFVPLKLFPEVTLYTLTGYVCAWIKAGASLEGKHNNVPQ